MDRMKETYETMLGLAAEMVLDEAIARYQRARLEREIDEALAAGDELAFKRLSAMLKQWKAS